MQIAKREKKITVKFFLNEAVEPIMGESKKKHYPLYVQVTYNRKNMQFKSKYSEYYESLHGVKPSLLTFEEKVIKSVINYEIGKVKADYDLKGLKRKYEVYSVSILEAVEHYLKPKLRTSVFKTNNELSLTLNFDSAHSTTDKLYKAAQLLFKDFDSYLTDKLKEELEAYNHYQKFYRPVLTYNFPTLIDWADGSYRSELEKKLNDAFKNKPELIKSIKSLIDHSVKEKLEELGE
jgi:hypothetical protein